MRRALLRYGPARAQVAEMWHPGVDGPLPVVVLVHGGFWRARYTKGLMRPLAADLSRRGVAVLNVEYRRTGRGGGGGGWPSTMEDLAAGVDLLARVPGVDLDRVAVCGHSAGGQLALWSAARHLLTEGSPGAAPAVRPCGVVSLAGVTDLAAAASRGVGSGAVELLLGGRPDDVPERYAVASPSALVPVGVETVLVHGTADAAVPYDLSEGYSAAAGAAGDPVRLLGLEGVDHMSLIDVRSAAWAQSRAALLGLLGCAADPAAGTSSRAVPETGAQLD